MSSGRILFIDAYDSFSNNIISLLKEKLPVLVESIHIDDSRFVFNDDVFLNYLQHFDAVVAGPGPGHPANAGDVGLIAKLWTLDDEHRLPVLGICLGFQSLCLAYGASVDRLKQPRHGLVTPVSHCSNDVFASTGEVFATQYHSLNVKLGGHHGAANAQDDIWTAGRQCPELLPLAWDSSDAENGPILMGVKHTSKPLRGLQYHPESICTTTEGHKLVVNWWEDACRWNAECRHSRATEVPYALQSLDSYRHYRSLASERRDDSLHWTSCKISKRPDAASVVEALKSRTPGYTPILLESGTRDGQPVNPETGRFSIIGVQDEYSLHIRYCISARRLDIIQGADPLLSETLAVADVFSTLEQIVADRKVAKGPAESPFWGGLMGFVSYEAGLETIDVSPSTSTPNKPDIEFVFVERSVVVDHVTDTLYIQSLRDEDQTWLESTKSLLPGLDDISVAPKTHESSTRHTSTLISGPDKTAYCQKVAECQEHLRAGSSYELCLTDQTQIHSAEDPWSVYCRLRSQNPAPFGAFLDLQSSEPSSPGITVLSSSPERFLSWSRCGKCQFRPIKGTVKKAPGVTRQSAEEILSSPKEQAENLMIVDLIRHDLSSVAGVSSVQVPKLMTVEEYATVYQLVSVISGQLSPATSGISVLAASLPPGSMTGAPKKRSCSLLSGIESNRTRGLYSGVLGYLDVGGGGDFSVVIRTAFRYGDEDVWRIGAGGAVTVLSEPEAEWEEMLAKRESLLRVFGL